MPQQGGDGRRHRKVDFTAVNHIDYVDYKNVDPLERFVSERSEILPRRVTGASTKNQHKLAIAIKRVRIMGLSSLVAED